MSLARGTHRPPYGSTRFARSVKFAMVVRGTTVPCTSLLTTLPPRFRLWRTAHWADAWLRAPGGFASRPFGAPNGKSARLKSRSRFLLAAYMPLLRIRIKGFPLDDPLATFFSAPSSHRPSGGFAIRRINRRTPGFCAEKEPFLAPFSIVPREQ